MATPFSLKMKHIQNLNIWVMSSCHVLMGCQNVVMLTVWRGPCIFNGGLVDGRVYQEILAEVLEVAVHAGSAPHGCNA